MSVFITCNGYTYDNLKNLTFAPEYDPTLETLPICEFGAEIVTTDAAQTFKGADANLYENRCGTDELLAGCYTVKEAEQIAPGVVRILAKSYLDYLDGRVLPAKLYTSTVTIDDFFKDLFIGEVVEECEAMWVWDDDAPPIRYNGSTYIHSGHFFPRQTARERLRTYCQATGNRVIQWGGNTVYGLYVTRDTRNTLTNTNVLLPTETYKQPVVKRASDIGIVRVTGYKNFTETYQSQEDGWLKYTIQEGWADPNTGLTQDEDALYYKPSTYEYALNDGSKGIVEIKDNLSMKPVTESTRTAVVMAYFTHYEVELEALCTAKQNYSNTNYSRYFWPGELLAFSIDDSGQVYCGMIKAAEYAFGILARVKLTIMTDMLPISTATVELNYKYTKDGGDVVFLRKVYHLPPLAYMRYPIPEYMHTFDGDEPVTLRSTYSVHISGTIAGNAGTTQSHDLNYRLL